MWMWLHHLLNPHCEHCEQKRDSKDEIIEMLRTELARERAQNERILDRFVEKQLQPREHIPDASELPFVKVGVRGVNWNVKKRELEEQHRIKVDVDNQRKSMIESMEEKLGLKEEGEVASNG